MSNVYMLYIIYIRIYVVLLLYIYACVRVSTIEYIKLWISDH